MSSLRLIKQVDVVNPTNLLRVDNVFSDDFEFYKIIVSGLYANGTTNINAFMRLVSEDGIANVNTYYAYGARTIVSETSATSDNRNTGDSSFEQLLPPMGQEPDFTCGVIDVFYPYQDEHTKVMGIGVSFQSTNLMRTKMGGGAYETKEVYTGFEFNTDIGNLELFAGGQIKVYGVRDA